MKQINNILVGVTGGIAAYKAVTLVRLLVDAGFNVRVVMTKSATSFIAPLTFQACSGHQVFTSLSDTITTDSMAHIALAKWADMIVIAPATAHFIAKAANGFADDLLTNICLVNKAKMIIAPAMNINMWSHPATQNNIKLLHDRDAHIIMPESGSLACGDEGVGRLPEPEKIFDIIKNTACLDPFWQQQRILITAGPTQEQIDPIRFLSNRSSGKMGFALASAAASLGAAVILVHGPTHLPIPAGVKSIPVKTAVQMYQVVMNNINHIDMFIGAAAVANYRVAIPVDQKIKSTHDQMQLSLIKNPDIIKSVAALNPRPFVVGFAAETENLIQSARKKISEKRLDLIVANDISNEQGMGAEDNCATLLNHAGEIIAKSEKLPKNQLAHYIMDIIKKEK